MQPCARTLQWLRGSCAGEGGIGRREAERDWAARGGARLSDVCESSLG